MSSPLSESVLVLGVGNPLMGDEGLGPRVVEYLLATYGFPQNVEVVDAGTMGFSILNLFQGPDVIIVVDAVQGTGQDAGTVVQLDAEEMSPNQVMHSLHDARIVDVVQAAALIGVEPEVVCIGVEVAQIVHWEMDLTPVVEASIPYVAEAVVDLLTRRDIAIERLTKLSAAGAEPISSSPEQRDRIPGTPRVIGGLRTKDDIARFIEEPTDKPAESHTTEDASTGEAADEGA